MAEANDPFTLFATWMAEAEAAEPNDANAMCLATSTPDGRPTARMVLLKGVDGAAGGPAGEKRGFVFYTNTESRKGGQIAANPHVAATFHWKSLHRSIRIEGEARPVGAAEADAYYASRARGSRIGAWASQQSRPLPDRFALEKAVAEYTMKFGLGEIPRPAYWSGFRIVPQRIEFWRDMPFRLHDRNVFHAEAGTWRTEKLFP